MAETVLARRPDVSLSFVGSVGGFERPLLQESAVPFEHIDEVRAGPLHGVGLVRALISLAQLAFGTIQAFALVLRRRPSVLLLTGGWVGLPVALACFVLRVPSLIYLPDIEPGLTIRMLRYLVTRVAVTVDDSARYFRAGHTITTGYPLRQQMLTATRSAGVKHFELDETRKTLLVFGGSRGARSINEAVIAILPALLEAGWQVIHVTGTLDWESMDARLAALGRPRHVHVFPYLHSEMGMAMAAADLAVCRSGASTLGELPLFGLPAILVPYPHAWRYQKVNAEWLVERGAAVLLEDGALRERLLPLILELGNDTARLAAMRAKAVALAQPDGAWNIGRELLRLAGEAA